MAGLAAIRGLGIMVDILVRGTALLALGLFAAALLRRRSAALRHFVLSVFIIGLLFLPMLSLLPSGYGLRLLPAWLTVAASPRGPAGDVFAGQNGTPDVTGRPGGGRASAMIGTADGRSLSGLPSRVALKSRPADAAAGVSRLAAILAPAAACVWLAGLMFLLARLAAGLAGARRLSREGLPVNDQTWREIFDRFLDSVPLARRVRLKRHDEVAVPLTWGIVRPTVLVPAASDTWSVEERSSALFHELSHIKRLDFLVLMLVRLSLAVQWLNPLGRPALRRLKAEQEKACDELVVKAGIKPSTYAANLLSLKQSAALSWSPSVALLGILETPAASPLKERLVAILGKNLLTKEFRMRTKIVLTLSVIGLVAFIGLARPAARPANAQTASSSGQTAAAQDATKARPAEAPKPVPQAAPAGSVVPAEPKPAGAAPAPAPSVGAPAPIGQAPAAGPAPMSVEGQPAPAAKPVEATAPVPGLAPEDKEQPSKMKELVVTPLPGGKDRLVLLVTNGQEKRTIRPGRAVTLKLDAAGKNVVIAPEGGKIAVVPDQDVRVIVEGGTIAFAKKEREVVVGRDSFLDLREDESGDDVIAAYHVPGFTIKESGAPDGPFKMKEDQFNALDRELLAEKKAKLAKGEALIAVDKELAMEMDKLKERMAEAAAREIDVKKNLEATMQALAKVQDEAVRARLADLNKQLAQETLANLKGQERELKLSLEQAIRAQESMKAEREIDAAMAEKQAEIIKDKIDADLKGNLEKYESQARTEEVIAEKRARAMKERREELLAEGRELPEKNLGEPGNAFVVMPDSGNSPFALVTADGALTIYVRVKPGESAQPGPDIEKAAARMRKALPEGYTLETKFDKPGRLFLIVVKGAKPGADNGALLDRLFKVLKEETR